MKSAFERKSLCGASICGNFLTIGLFVNLIFNCLLVLKSTTEILSLYRYVPLAIFIDTLFPDIVGIKAKSGEMNCCSACRGEETTIVVDSKKPNRDFFAILKTFTNQ